MPIVSLPSVMTNAPLSGACRATASRYIRKCMEISEWSFHSNRFDLVVLRNLVDHVLSLGDRSGHFVGEQLHLDSALRGLENGLFVRHHHSRERFSSTCATVFIPTITTDTASLSSTNRSASCAGVTPAWLARSFTRSATAVSCAT